MNINSQSILQQIARICIMDIVLNYTDRIPMLCDNFGNSTNLMFCYTNSNTCSVYAVDNSIVSITAHQDLFKYLQRIDSFVLAVFKYIHKLGRNSTTYWIPHAVPVMDFLQSFSSYR